MFNVQSLRQQFPSLNRLRDGIAPVFLDGPGGTQTPRVVVDAMVRYLTECNANHGGVFATSVESDAVLAEAHRAVADLLNAPSPDEVVFGANMTTLTFHLSRSVARTWKAGDEVVVTRLDHDANVSPWVLAAHDAGATVKFVELRPEDCTLDEEDLARKVGPRTRLLALGCASNAVGSVNAVKRAADLAHAHGAQVFLDAVHYAPHGPIDVQDWGCDYLACSAYKFFGPHVGILWGRRELLEGLFAYKVRPAANSLPDKWMTGTQNHEGIAGVTAAVDYLASLAGPDGPDDRRSRLRAAMSSIWEYETTLSARLLRGLAGRQRFTVWGITDPTAFDRRVPTVSVTVKDRTPQQMAEHLAARQIYAWHGNFYALELTERLELEERGGLLRLGLVHYNTPEEVDRLLQALDEL
jgi:cysteine desulfurase family protein (TIGR01976 family)